jgi:uncharacterized membrane protein YcfT
MDISHTSVPVWNMPMSNSVNTAPSPLSPKTHRVDWVDSAKGICIILVVMMHSTLGVEAALGETGALNTFIAWAQPFRMPDFFLISGLFLMRRIDVPWKDYLDKKVVHFLYFYLLWMTIQFLFKGYGIYKTDGAAGLAQQYALAFFEPFGTLWFIYLLPIFFVVTKLTRNLPAILVFAIAAALEILPIHTGWIMIDEFASRFVYFFAGYWLAKHIFTFADDMDRLGVAGLAAALVIWGAFHTQVFRLGFADAPVIGLALGFLGTAAVVSAGVLLTRFRWGEAIRYLGENSIVVYLSFFLFMAFTRTALIKLMPQLGTDVISLVTTAAGVIGPVILHFVTRKTPLKYLFIRPTFAKVETWSKLWQSDGHDKLAHKPQTR